MPQNRLVVISDLHMGSGVIDDFEPEIEDHLISFLKYWSKEGTGTELVINGDLLDFVQAPPYKCSGLRGRAKDGTPLCFTQVQSRDKLKAIHQEHQTTFQALGDFLACRSDNKIVLLPGNHDADFFWPMVRVDFQSLVCGKSQELAERLIFWLDPVYEPIAFPGVRIEHGHQYDSVNRFFYKDQPCWSTKCPPICQDEGGTERLYECSGTRFLIQYLNDLDRDYPYVDNVKPFTRFLQLFGASARHGPLKALVAIGRMNGYLAKTLVTKPGDVLELGKEGKGESSAEAVRAAFRRSAPSLQQEFMEAVLKRGFNLNANPDLLLENDASAEPLLEFLAENQDVLDIIDSNQGQTLKLVQSFFANETDDLRSEALKIAGQDMTVIMGHTHEVVDSPRYINTGSWTRYYKIPKGDSMHSWEILKREGWKQFPYELNYALAIPGLQPRAVLKNYYRSEEADA